MNYDDFFIMDTPQHQYSGEDVPNDIFVVFCNGWKTGANEDQYKDVIKQLLSSLGIAFKSEDTKIDILTSKFNIEAKYYNKHPDEKFDEIISQIICYQRKRLYLGFVPSPYIIAISNRRAIIMKTDKIMSLIETDNWDDKTAASTVVPERINAVKNLRLSYNDYYNMYDIDDMRAFVNKINKLEKLDKITITKEFIFSDFLQFSAKSNDDWNNILNDYLYKLYNGLLEGKSSCSSLPKEEAYDIIMEGSASHVIVHSNPEELHKHVVVLKDIKQGIDHSLINYNPKMGGIVISDAHEILMYVINKGISRENIIMGTHHPEELYNINIKKINVTELAKDNIMNTEKEISLCMGNPPWEVYKDREFFIKVVSAESFVNGGCVNLIMCANFLRGSNERSFVNL